MKDKRNCIWFRIPSQGLMTLVLLFISMACFPQAQRKLALVIGIQKYISISPLRNSVNDATDMSNALRSKGFEVTLLINPPTKKEIKAAIKDYYDRMSSISNAVGIIYYAGHGIQREGENYLIPAAAVLEVPGDLDDQCVKLNVLMSVLSTTNNLNILLLDACRTNTIPALSREVSKGLANVVAPTGSIVVFATQPGTVASDGDGRNGLFTSKMLKYMDVPNMNIGEVFKKVKQEVNAESAGKQLPSVIDNSIGGDFYFTYSGDPVSPLLTKQSTETEVNPERSPASNAPASDDPMKNQLTNLLNRKKPTPGQEDTASKDDSDEIFTITEQPPSPVGGLTAFYNKFVNVKLKYPAQARRMGIGGKVFVEFVVEKDGSITNIKSIKGIGAGCDEEAVRVMSQSSPWSPAINNGKPVRCRYVLPISFKLG